MISSIGSRGVGFGGGPVTRTLNFCNDTARKRSWALQPQALKTALINIATAAALDCKSVDWMGHRRAVREVIGKRPAETKIELIAPATPVGSLSRLKFLRLRAGYSLAS